MGVYGLEGYLDNNPAVAKKVNILELIERYRKEEKRKPEIVVDGTNVMRRLYDGKKLSWITGGQMKEFANTVKGFISAFKNAELVFFFDGPQMDVKMPRINARRKGKIKAIHELFDNLKIRKNFKQDEAKGLYFPDNTPFIVKYVAKQCGCKVFNASEECDIEIVKYALENRCMAILSQDSDFIIFRSAHYYFSMKHFELEQMTTINYDREALASYLGVRSDHLPLLATLLGNDIVQKETLEKFHKNVSRRKNNYNNLITSIGKSIRDIPIEDFQISPENLKDLASVVFHDENKHTLLQKSIQSYDPEAVINCNPTPLTDDKWSEILKKLEDLHRRDYISSLIYGIISKKQYSCGACFEDYREVDLPPSQKILKPLRKKLYGVLLYEHPGECKVKEWAVHSLNNNNTKFDEVEVGKTKVNHPGLLSLWAGQSAEDQWNLIGEICGVSASEVKALPHTLIIPAFSLNYLCSNVKLGDDEIRSLAASATLAETYNNSNYNLTDLISTNSRPLRLYALLTKTFSFMMEVFNAVGDPILPEEITPSNYQNGNLFYLKYVEATEKKFSDSDLCNNDESSLRKYKQLMKLARKKNQTS